MYGCALTVGCVVYGDVCVGCLGVVRFGLVWFGVRWAFDFADVFVWLRLVYWCLRGVCCVYVFVVCNLSLCEGWCIVLVFVDGISVAVCVVMW